jgi:hypothetical protein
MKRYLCILALVCLVTHRGNGNIILTSENRGVDVSGSAGGPGGSQTYVGSHGPAAPFSDFGSTASGESEWSDATGRYKSNGFSTQSSSITDNCILLRGELFGKIWSNLQDLSQDRSSFVGHNNFEIGFTVQTPQRFDLGLYDDLHYFWGKGTAYGVGATPVLTSANGINVLSSAQISYVESSYYVDYFGILTPGTYTLNWDHGFTLLPYADIGSGEYVSYGMQFDVEDAQAVPETGSLIPAALLLTPFGMQGARHLRNRFKTQSLLKKQRNQRKLDNSTPSPREWFS